MLVTLLALVLDKTDLVGHVLTTRGRGSGHWKGKGRGHEDRVKDEENGGPKYDKTKISMLSKS